jgi:hypothetical protein
MWKLWEISESCLNRKGHFCLPYSHSILLYHRIYLFLKKGAIVIVPWGNKIWAFSWDSKSRPSKGTGVSGTMRKEWQKWRSPQEQAWCVVLQLGMSQSLQMSLSELRQATYNQGRSLRKWREERREKRGSMQGVLPLTSLWHGVSPNEGIYRGAGHSWLHPRQTPSD